MKEVIKSISDCCAGTTKQINSIYKAMIKFVVTKVNESRSYPCNALWDSDRYIHCFFNDFANSNNLTLNILRLVELRIRRAILFHSVVVDGKKVLIK